MNPPARSILTELHDALVGGIRRRGPDAFGLIITALAWVVVFVLTFAVLFGVSRLAGHQVATYPFAGMASLSAGASSALTWWKTKPGG